MGKDLCIRFEARKLLIKTDNDKMVSNAARRADSMLNYPLGRPEDDTDQPHEGAPS